MDTMIGHTTWRQVISMFLIVIYVLFVLDNLVPAMKIHVSESLRKMIPITVILSLAIASFNLPSFHA
jgi:hypothetical protein